MQVGEVKDAVRVAVKVEDRAGAKAVVRDVDKAEVTAGAKGVVKAVAVITQVVQPRGCFRAR